MNEPHNLNGKIIKILFSYHFIFGNNSPQSKEETNRHFDGAGVLCRGLTTQSVIDAEMNKSEELNKQYFVTIE